MQKAREGRLLLHKSLGMAALASRYAATPFNYECAGNPTVTASHMVDQVFDLSGFRS